MEGPSLVIARNEMSPAIGQKLRRTGGNTRTPVAELKGQVLTDIGTWGKHLLLFFPDQVLKVHFLLWGSYRVNEPRENRKPRMVLFFPGIKIYFYSCSVKLLEEDVENLYDWSADVLSPSWDPERALAKLRRHPQRLLCDVLLDQSIFAGVGNIIKNEVLFRLRLHPERVFSSLSPARARALVFEAHRYSWQFFYWKNAYELKKHWLIMRKKTCPNCGGPVTRRETGRTRRLSHFCPRCQK